jgi:hypothetical protein
MLCFREDLGKQIWFGLELSSSEEKVDRFLACKITNTNDDLLVLLAS